MGGRQRRVKTQREGFQRCDPFADRLGRPIALLLLFIIYRVAGVVGDDARTAGRTSNGRLALGLILETAN